MRATSSRSPAAATPSATGLPERPVAPDTATRRFTPPAEGSDRPRRPRRRTRPRRGRCRRPRGARAPRAASERRDLLRRDGLDPCGDLVGIQDLGVGDQVLAEPRHARGRRLERQQQAAREVPLRALELAWPEVARCQRRRSRRARSRGTPRGARVASRRTPRPGRTRRTPSGRSRPSRPCPVARGSPGTASTRPCRRASRRAGRARTDRRRRGRARARRRQTWNCSVSFSWNLRPGRRPPADGGCGSRAAAGDGPISEDASSHRAS